MGLALALGCDGPEGGGGPGSTGDPTGASSEAPETTGADSDPGATGADSGEPAPTCPEGPGSAMVGEACSANADCASTICTLHRDAPPDLTAVCAAPSPGCGTRLTGTVLDLVSRQPVAGIDVRAVQGLDAAFDVAGAPAMLTTLSAPDGRVDAFADEIVSPVIGLVAVQQGPGFALTVSGLALSSNGMASEIHDLWVVSRDAVTAWSAMLSLDPELPATVLPLDGPVGGAVGLVRDANGQPVAGAVVTSAADQPSSFVRYLAPDGTFTAPATSELGLFVLLQPSLAEVFTVELDGAEVGGGTASSIAGAVTTLVVTLP